MAQGCPLQNPEKGVGYCVLCEQLKSGAGCMIMSTYEQVGMIRRRLDDLEEEFDLLDRQHQAMEDFLQRLVQALSPAAEQEAQPAESQQVAKP